MQGTIETYSKDKKNGFLKGIDGNKYYFEEDNFASETDINNIKENSNVSFELVNIGNNYIQVKNIEIKPFNLQNKNTNYIYNGKIKFYNKDKGFGFIVSNELINDIYFYITEWKSNSTPCNEDKVSFQIEKQKDKREKAINISLIKEHSNNNYDWNKGLKNSISINSGSVSSGDKLVCNGCGRKIYPRLVTYGGNPSHSLCPFCGTVVADFRKKIPLENWILLPILSFLAIWILSVIF